MENIKVFWGTDHKVGSTMIAQSCAEVLASNSVGDVLLLTLGGCPGDDYIEGNAIGLKEIRNRLSCNLISKNNIRDYTSKIGNMYKINGLKNPKAMYSFTPEMVENLLNACSSFHSVIVDCDSDLNNPLSLTALTMTRNNYFVLSQQESSLRKWERSKELLSTINAIPRSIVINKYIKGDQYNLSYLSKRIGYHQNIFNTINESDFGLQAEAERKSILHFGEKQYEKDIKRLIN